MADREIGGVKVSIGLDNAQLKEGITQTQASLKKLTQSFESEMKVAQAQFKLAGAELGEFASKSSQLALKTDSLSKQLDIQKNIVKSLTNEYENAVQAKGKDAQKTQYLETRLLQAKEKQVLLENAIKSTNAELEKQSNKLLVFSEKMKEVNAGLKSVEKAFYEAGSKISSAGTALTVGVTAPLVLAGKNMLDMAMNAVESENLFEVSMGGMAKSAREWSEQLRRELGLNAYVVRENVGTFNVMLDSMGLTKTAAFEMSKGLTQLSYDMASFYNLKPEQAFEKLQSGISGEVEPLKSLGILVNETTVQTYAYTNGIAKQGEQLTEQQKVMARYGAIMEATKAAQGDLARTMDSPINQLRIAKEQFNNLSIELGAKLIPVFMNVLEKVNQMVKWFSSLSDEQKEFAVKVALVVAAIGPALLILGKLVTAIGGAITTVRALSAAFSFLAANPAVLAIMAVVAAVGLLAYAAGSADREVKKMTEQMIENIEKEKEAALTAIDKKHEARLDALSTELAREDEASGKRMELMQAEYEKEVKSASDKERILKKNLDERKSALDKAYNENIQRIRDEYGVFEEKEKTKTDIITETAQKNKELLDEELKTAEDTYNKSIAKIREEYGVFEQKAQSKTDIIKEQAAKQKDIIDQVLKLSEDVAKQEGKAFTDTYDAILDKAREIHDEKIRMYEDEYLKSISIIDSDLANKIKALKDEIKSIEDKTDEEDRIQKEQQDRERIAVLEKKVAEAKDDEELKQAQEDLKNEINRINREKELENRRIKIESLQEQIQKETDSAEEAKNKVLETLKKKVAEEKNILDRAADEKVLQLQKERIEKENAEAAKLEAVKTRVTKEKDAIDKASAQQIAQIQAERKAKEDAESAKYEAAKKAMDDEEAALDGWAERYKAKLAEELAEKQRIEKEKLKAVQDRIAEEQRLENIRIAEEMKQVEEQARTEKETAQLKSMEAEFKALVDKPVWLKTAFDLINEVKLQNDIKKEKQRLHDIGIPGYASGVDFAPGGLSLVGEEGPELVYLPRGAQVVPNNISRQLMAVSRLQIPSGTTNNYSSHASVVNIKVENRGTIVGSSGMEEFAEAVSRKIGRRFGLSVGGAF